MNVNQNQLRKIKRNQKIGNIKLSLSCLPIFKQDKQPKIIGKKSLKTMDSLNSQSANSQIIGTKEENNKENKQKALKCFSDFYTFGQKIGEGAHGIVKKCSLKGQLQTFAVKTIRLDMEHILFLKENFVQIKKLKHKYIIGYKALFLEQKKQQCHLVMEYLPYPDLLNINIKDQKQLQQIVYQVLTTLAYIHSQGICHRDIKPENILYDEQHKTIKIIDFGISKKLTNRNIKKEMLTQTGTLYYRAPEMFEGGGYDERIDLWALGATIYKLMTGSTPFQSEYHSQTINNIIKGNVTFPAKTEEKYSKAARNLVMRLLKRKQERLTANQALMDLWLIDLYKNADQLTRSLTQTHKALRIFGKSKNYMQNLFRTNTNQKKELFDNQSTSPELILKRLKLSQLWGQQQQSNIYQGEDACQQIQF